jgi:hypothetical protein
MMFISISYYMTGQPMDSSRFTAFAAICLINAAASESLGLLIGSIFSITVGDNKPLQSEKLCNLRDVYVAMVAYAKCLQAVVVK